MEKENVILFWSGGKDSAFALYRILDGGRYNVVGLLTTINASFKRVSMHGVREELLEKQAEALGLELIKMYVEKPTNAEYEKQMHAYLKPLKNKGINKIVFGDIFLEDLREYREKILSGLGFECLFPLWKQNTAGLINEFLSLNFKTVVCCINDSFPDDTWVGRIIDQSFLNELPAGIDPCGENGEYHTFCFEGPVFKTPVEFTVGRKIFRPLEINQEEQCSLPSEKVKGFMYCDLLPKEIL